MPMTWTNEADVQLLLNILKIHDIKLDYAALATATGPDVTALAVKKHIQKLREKAEKGGLNSTSTAGPKTPTGATKSAAKKGNKRNARGDAKGLGESQDAVDDDEAVKVEKMEPGKRIKLERGRFVLDESGEE